MNRFGRIYTHIVDNQISSRTITRHSRSQGTASDQKLRWQTCTLPENKRGNQFDACVNIVQKKIGKIEC